MAVQRERAGLPLVRAPTDTRSALATGRHAPGFEVAPHPITKGGDERLQVLVCAGLHAPDLHEQLGRCAPRHGQEAERHALCRLCAAPRSVAVLVQGAAVRQQLLIDGLDLLSDEAETCAPPLVSESLRLPAPQCVGPLGARHRSAQGVVNATYEPTSLRLPLLHG